RTSVRIERIRSRSMPDLPAQDGGRWLQAAVRRQVYQRGGRAARLCPPSPNRVQSLRADSASFTFFRQIIAYLLTLRTATASLRLRRSGPPPHRWQRRRNSRMMTVLTFALRATSSLKNRPDAISRNPHEVGGTDSERITDRHLPAGVAVGSR